MPPLRLTLTSTLLLLSTGFSKDYLPPGGGWDYLFEGDGAAGSATEALDGTWNHNNSSDQWDGTAPGTGNPGGISVVPVSGEPGNSALLMVDAVTTSGTNNNRRFALTHDLASGEGVPEDFLDDGATIAFRMRLPTSAGDLPSAPDGLNPHSGGKGMINLRSAGGRISFAMGMAGKDSSYQQNGMLISDGNATFFQALDPTEWNEFWVTTRQNSTDSSLYDLRVYRNGSIVPLLTRSIRLSTSIDAAYPYLSLQLSATNQTAAVEVDYFAFKDGMHLPNDSDGDALPDIWELANFPDLAQSGEDDTESDGLTNSEEFNLGTDPNLADTDGDGLSDAAEFNQHGTNPTLADSDGDNLSDRQELEGDPATNPMVADSDGDELTDGDEVLTHGSNPLLADTDGDGYKDGIEVAFGYDPNDPESTPTVPTLDDLLISEFMADNNDTLTDSDGDTPDWIELWNPTSSPISLAGHYLTDNQQVPNKWALPTITLQPDDYVIIFASGKDRFGPGNQWHTNFKLTSNGEYLGLARDDGEDGFTLLSEYAPTYPDQKEGISYGLNADSLEHGYLRAPSPGQINGETAAGFVADTTFNIDRGFFDTPFDLEITSSTEGATIRYTTNGSTPTVNSGSIYTQPIRISNTTVLRAAAFKDNYFATNVDTQTYLFLDDVRTQYANGAAPSGWPTGNVNGQQFNYGMDPDITSQYSAQQMIDALSAVPSISLVTDQSNLTASNGIYTNPGSRGKLWERPASFEILDSSGLKDHTQSNCGLRIRGGFSRSTSNPKHAFRLFFRNEYGAGKLNYPLFEGDGTDQFDKIDLRTSQNYSWSFQGDGNNTFLREVLGRDLQGAIGQPYTKSRYYHLYLNGVYWGLFMTQERAEATFGEAYLGGDSDDYDTIKSAGNAGGYNTEATDGSMAGGSDWYRLWDLLRNQRNAPTMARFMQMQGLNPDGSRNPELPVYLDVNNLIDYTLIIGYTGNYDAPLSDFLGGASNNWFATRNRERDDLGFQFFVHDGEHSMGAGGRWNNANDRINTGNGSGQRNDYSRSNPAFMHFDLEESTEEYRLRFADRAHAVLFNNGLLTKDSVLAILENRREIVEKVIIAEAARWGDSKRTNWWQRAFGESDWRNAVNSLVNTINSRRDIFLGHLRTANLYPDLPAPTYAQHGGTVADGSKVTIAAPNQATRVYYMIGTGNSDDQDWQDDLDPRLLGGSPNPNAGILNVSGGGEGVSATTYIQNGSTWKYLDDGSNQGTAWRTVGFNDSGWQSGPAELGFGDNDETTIINSGPAGQRFATTYFRKVVNIDNPAVFGDFELLLTYDDSYAVFVNGSEVARHPGLSQNAAFNEFSSNVVANNAIDTLSIPTSAFTAGNNLIAVEIHQNAATSSDLSFDLQLTGKPIGDGNTITLLIPEAITSPVWVKSRSYNASRNEWSALNQAFFTTAPAASAENIVISQVHYHPRSPDAGELQIDPDFDQDDFEFVEVMNISQAPVDLGGCAFVLIASGNNLEGIEFSFPLGTLIDPGQRLVVAANSTAFAARYPDVDLAGDYTNRLDNNGEWITLLDKSEDIIQSFRYNDASPWPEQADGDGPSLILNNPGLDTDPAAPSSWTASLTLDGSPGQEESPAPLAIINVENERSGDATTSFKITFTSSPNQIYTVERSRNLVEWESLWQGNVTVSDGVSSFTDETPPLDGNAVFYRVRVSD